MPKSSNQKLKILYLLKILNEKTDDTHSLTVQEMIDELSKYNISAERKSLYSDIEMLQLFGVDILSSKSKTTGYYIGSRDFELPEVKLLVDAVQTSKFITQKKSEELIKKLENLLSHYDAQNLQGQVYVANRIKTMNETIYYNVDKINNAINSNKKITYKYFEYNIKKEKSFRHNGALYKVSPLALTWDDENYYLIGFDSKEQKIKHYRVDKMFDINEIDEKREGILEYKKQDTALYARKVFGMYGGEDVTVKLLVKNYLVGVMLDRFGKDIIITPENENEFSISVSVKESPQFYGWVANFGDEIEILSPKSVRDNFLNRIESIIKRCRK